MCSPQKQRCANPGSKSRVNRVCGVIVAWIEGVDEKRGGRDVRRCEGTSLRAGCVRRALPSAGASGAGATRECTGPLDRGCVKRGGVNTDELWCEEVVCEASGNVWGSSWVAGDGICAWATALQVKRAWSKKASTRTSARFCDLQSSCPQCHALVYSARYGKSWIQRAEHHVQDPVVSSLTPVTASARRRLSSGVIRDTGLVTSSLL